MDSEVIAGPSKVQFPDDRSRFVSRRTNSLDVPDSRPRTISANLDSAATRHPRRRQVNSLSVPVNHHKNRTDEPSLTFSDEYDLAHEDPQILQDVQRALKGKARRDARIKSGLPVPPPRSERTSPGTPPLSSPNHSAFPTSISAPVPKVHAEVDFSPATKASSLPPHPVPRSLDDGATLDWSYSGDNDKHERKWTRSISISKGKEKPNDRPSSLSAQDHKFTRHIDVIRSRASPQTLYKAELVGRQLGRRYQFLLSSSTNNILQVSRWYGQQTVPLRNEIEDAEPFLWLSHYDRKRRKHDLRSPLHLSALIIERFVQSVLNHDPSSFAMETIPEDHNWSNPSFPRSAVAPLPVVPPQYPFSMRSSNQSLGMPYYGSISQEDGISFEPILRSARNSFDSRRSADSLLSSFQDAPHSRSNLPSPASSRLHVKDFAISPLKAKEDTTDPRGSVSEDGASRINHVKKTFRPPEVDLNHSDGELGVRVVISRPPSEEPPPDSPSLNLPSAESEPLATAIQSSAAPQLSHARILGRRRRTSLPSSSRLPADSWERQRQEEANEEKLLQEYERKSELVERLAAENGRTRMQLNRLAHAIREYDTGYSKVMTRLGLPHVSLSSDVFEAFNHDPAAVTTSTRRFNGWRAAEDIHDRVVRQRQTLQSFIANALQNEKLLGHGVLEGPLRELLTVLAELEGQRDEVVGKEAEVAKLLKEVQATEAEARTAFERASTVTSVAYTELNTIASLQESYKDQYQHIWDWSMNAVTLLFDTVTPFWRTYGRTILDDVIAFMVIPLYRNEFTGEPKRYPIATFPRRSFRHWVGLVVFFLTSSSVLHLHGKTTASSLRHYSLSNIEHLGIRYALIPFFWAFIISQCIAVTLEAAIVLIQLSVWLWWLGWAARIFS